MTANIFREKIEDEIAQLDEHQLEDLYRVIHYYRLGTHAEARQNNSIKSEPPKQILKRVLQRMQTNSLTPDAPQLSREQLHECPTHATEFGCDLEGVKIGLLFCASGL